MALPTNQPIRPDRNDAMADDAAAAAGRHARSRLLEENQEQRFHPIYNYAVVTDAEEGLFLVNVDTLADGEPRNNFLRRARSPRRSLEREWRARPAPATSRWPAITPISPPTPAWSSSTSTIRSSPRHVATMPLTDARASALQFRYLWVTDAEGLKLFDVTDMANPRPVPGRDGAARRRPAHLSRPHLRLCRGQAAGPGDRQRHQSGAAGGADRSSPSTARMNDVEDVDRRLDQRLALRLCRRRPQRHEGAPAHLARDSQPNFYGFSPRPVPELIAWARTPSPALSLCPRASTATARVDETGGQIAVFGRLGSRPFNRAEMERLFLNSRGLPYKVSDTGTMEDWVAPGAARRRPHSGDGRTSRSVEAPLRSSCACR